MSTERSVSVMKKILGCIRKADRDFSLIEDGDKIAVGVSGGKDSQVLAHIVKKLYPDVPCVFVNTGLEYDSVRKKRY